MASGNFFWEGACYLSAKICMMCIDLLYFDYRPKQFLCMHFITSLLLFPRDCGSVNVSLHI